MQKLRNRFIVIFTLGLLSAIGPFSIDMYLPGFSGIAQSLNTSVAQVGLSLSSFFVGISVGQLIYGPLLDRFGRKIPLYVGLGVYLATSIFCALVTSVDMLILIRFFQALGSCAGMVVSRALIRDLFPVHENAKIFSYLMLVVAISPLLAPTTGGFLTAAFGWRSIFVVLSIISVLTILAVYKWLPNGNPPITTMSLKPGPIVKDFIKVARIPKFYVYAMVSAVSASSLYAYVASAPNLFMKIYDVSEKDFGLIFAIIGVGLTLAGQINTLILKKYSSEQITKVVLFCQVILGIVLVVFTYFQWLNLYSMVTIIWFYLATQGLIYPNTSALAMSPFNKMAGTASALMGAVQLGIGALATALVSVLDNSTPMPMALIMLFCGVSALSFLIWGQHKMNSEAVPVHVLTEV